MSETKAGNIEAIRDWSKRYFYTKSDVSEFFTKLNTGLTAYKLTIIGPANADITITDNDQTNPQEYVIETSSSGVYIGLFFFNEGNTLSLSGSGVSATHVLSDYVDTIMLIAYVLLTPQMTSYNQPSGVVSASSEYSGRPAWIVFDRNISTFWTSAINKKIGEWIKYEFPDSEIVYKVKTRNISDNNYPSVMKGFKFQVSNNDEDWYDKKIITDNPLQANYEYEFVIDDPGSYKYYRFLCTDVWSSDPANGVGFGEIYIYGAA